ncbi:hypothetical protein AZE42_14025 [Rhizopogon vesiculosus]|uniref:Uncharacterized protein n=1 Tax=Rhizopogon vesiculosus TaxID=180088 RepID=A0A1J8QWN3_9AGAM|nr:hypothetical protein AZE42_14025 [Rhizopogon vesiculosus]
MTTVRRKLHAIRVRNSSSDAHNAEELLKQIIESGLVKLAVFFM